MKKYVKETNETCRVELLPKEEMFTEDVKEMYQELHDVILGMDGEKVKKILNGGKTEGFLNKVMIEKSFIKTLTDEYTIKTLAKKTVYGEERETICEEMVFDEPIGTVNGQESNIAEIKFKLLPWWKRNIFGLPFNFESFKVVADEEETVPQEPAAPTMNYSLPETRVAYSTPITGGNTGYQMTIFDY